MGEVIGSPIIFQVCDLNSFLNLQKYVCNESSHCSREEFEWKIFWHIIGEVTQAL